MRTIGRIIDSESDLDGSIAAHQMLLARACLREWRFCGDWVVTGPYETLIGRCGTGHGFSYTPIGELLLPIGDRPLESMVRSVNKYILRALCRWPGFASLDEPVTKGAFRHCGESLDEVRRFAGGITRDALNSYHPKARQIDELNIVSKGDGVFINAEVGLDGSRWGAFWLLDQPLPKKRRNERLDTFLRRVAVVLGKFIRRKGERE